MGVRAKGEAAAAVVQLRRFNSLHEGVEVAPGSPLANQLEAAQRAVAAYERAERELAKAT